MIDNKDWLGLSNREIDIANNNLIGKQFEKSVLHSQKAAEFALKALVANKNLDIRGHSLLQLMKRWYDHNPEMNRDDYDTIYNQCEDLEYHHIQPTYPLGLIKDTPPEYFSESIAADCYKYARNVISFVKNII